MATADSVKQKLRGLIDSANQTTGESDATLTDAVARLREGFGMGREPVTEPLTARENGSYSPRDGVDGFNHVDVDVHVDVPVITTGSLEVTENGGYSPGDYGYDYFDSVSVNVGFPAMENPASEEEVRIGKEYIGSDGLVYSGSMPEKSASDVTVTASDSSRNVSVRIPAGYYSEAVSISKKNVGGNAHMKFENSMFSVGSLLFPAYSGAQLPLALYLWNEVTANAYGTGMYYMPASIGLVLSSKLVINGAFYAESITLSGSATNQSIFSGSDLTGAYRLNLAIASSGEGDVIASMSLTNNGEEVDLSSGVAASVYSTLPMV